MSDDVIVVLCSCPTADSAADISHKLVEEGLAACINIIDGVQSIYLWDDHIQDEKETLLIIKTGEDRYSKLESRLEELHPYDVPEIVALPVSRGLPGYLKWVNSDER
jgi:periplasmic divalent cation tolerance protein